MAPWISINTMDLAACGMDGGEDRAFTGLVWSGRSGSVLACKHFGTPANTPDPKPLAARHTSAQGRAESSLATLELTGMLVNNPCALSNSTFPWDDVQSIGSE